MSLYKEPGRRGEFVVTTREALRLLGVRRNLLDQLERRAGIAGLKVREGYTEAELKRLVAHLRLILGR